MVWMCQQCSPGAHRVLPMDPCPALLLRIVDVDLSVDPALESDDGLVANQPPQDVMADAGGHRRLPSEDIRKSPEGGGDVVHGVHGCAPDGPPTRGVISPVDGVTTHLTHVDTAADSYPDTADRANQGI
jgi:hypothetical protein